MSYDLHDLITLMERLRDPSDGCPWDRQQTAESLIPHTLEEVYEVVDAIERQDWSHLAEELGDLLFQVVVYSELARELGQGFALMALAAFVREFVSDVAWAQCY
jgi:ATP diphosphatase